MVCIVTHSRHYYYITQYLIILINVYPTNKRQLPSQFSIIYYQFYVSCPTILLLLINIIIKMSQKLYYFSDSMVRGAISKLLQKVNDEIELRQFAKKNINIYSTEKSLIMYQQLLNQALISNSKLQTVHQNNEGKNIGFDRLMPSSINIIPQPINPVTNEIKIAKMKKTQTIIQNKSNLNNNLIQIRKYEPEDPKVKQLRHIIQQQQLMNKVIKVSIPARQKLPNFQYYYDYDASFQKSEAKPKSNLIEQKITAEVSQISEKVVKSSRKKSIIQTKSYNESDKDINRKNAKYVQFSNVKNLCEKFQSSCLGVKIRDQTQVIQKKKQQQRTVQEIRQQMKIRHLSKSEYQMVKLYGRSRSQKKQNQVIKTEPIIKNQTDNNKTNVKSLKSQKMKTQFSPVTQKNRYAKIHINSNYLLESLISQNNNHQDRDKQQTYTQKQKSKQSRKQLDKNDLYNINYIRKKSVLSNQPSHIISELPNLSKRSLFPKCREKLRESGSIIREYRKKFQQRLRK